MQESIRKFFRSVFLEKFEAAVEKLGELYMEKYKKLFNLRDRKSYFTKYKKKVFEKI